MSELDFLKLAGNWGAAGGALFLAWVLARKLDALTTTLVEVLTKTIERNTEMLTRVEETLRKCKGERG